jgi:predicted ester cyclase
VTTDELMDGWEAAWGGRDPGAFAELCTAGLHYEDPVVTLPLEGPGALGEHAERLWSAFPDVRIERAGDRLANERFVAAPVKVAGTNTAMLGDLPPTHRFLVVHVLFYCELQHGRLHRVRSFLDLVDAGRQLGLMPVRGGLGERALLMLRGFGLRRGRER